MPRQKVILILSLILCWTAYGRSDTRCAVNNLEGGDLIQNLPVGFDEFAFDIGREQSRAEVRITNRDKRPISGIFMVVDFEISGHYVMSMIFYLKTSAADLKPVARVPRIFESPAPLSASLLPGESYRDSEASVVRTQGCPDRARIAVLQISFARGRMFDYRSAGWRVDPSILDIKPWSFRTTYRGSFSVFSRLSVNEKGVPKVIAMSGVGSADGDDPELSSWLTDQIESNCDYVPGQYDGALISDEVDLLIRFNPLKESDPLQGVPKGWTRRGVVTLDLVWSDARRAYTLIYGGYPVFEGALGSGTSR